MDSLSEPEDLHSTSHFWSPQRCRVPACELPPHTAGPCHRLGDCPAQAHPFIFHLPPLHPQGLREPPMKNQPVKLVFVSWQEKSFLTQFKSSLKNSKAKERFPLNQCEMATSVSSRSFNRTKQTQAAAQATASCFSMCVTVPKRALKIHRKQMTELSQPCWNLKVKTKNKILSLY